MRQFFHTLARPVAFSLLLLGLSGTVRADDDEVMPDGRLEGYVAKDGEGFEKVALPPAGGGGTWALFVVMGVLCVGVMFKNGKRTHLD